MTMTDYDNRLTATLGRDGLLEFAGAILSAGREADTEEDAETASRAVTKLLDMAEAHTSPPEPEDRERDPEAPAYVPDVWDESPSYHLATEVRGVWKTMCGLHISWRAVSALLPVRLAERIGQRCERCYASARSDD